MPAWCIPSFAPPNWVFAPVWTTLYVLMAVAAWRVWRITGTDSRRRWSPMRVQLALNFWLERDLLCRRTRSGWRWSEIVLLVLAILATTILFFRRDRLAGLLFLPYLAWTGFRRCPESRLLGPEPLKTGFGQHCRGLAMSAPLPIYPLRSAWALPHAPDFVKEFNGMDRRTPQGSGLHAQ